VSERIGDLIIIEAEPDSRCELCGSIEETRPYGPNGERVCFKCGMKNEPATIRQMNKKLFGIGAA